jgi:hypothetical protein
MTIVERLRARLEVMKAARLDNCELFGELTCAVERIEELEAGPANVDYIQAFKWLDAACHPISKSSSERL